MHLPTKRAYNPLFADKLAKFADEILLHDQKRVVFEPQYFPWGGGGGVSLLPRLQSLQKIITIDPCMPY